MTKTEIFLADDRYAFEIERITDILRQGYAERVAAYPAAVDPAEVYERVLAALSTAGIDTGGFTAAGGRVEPERYGELAQALVDLEPDVCTGEIEADQVTFILAEIGNVWPASIRSSISARAQAQLEAAGKITGPILAGATSLAMRDPGVVREHLDAVAADARQVAASMKHFHQP